MEFLQNLISLPGDEMVHVVSFPGLGLEFTLNRVAIEILGRPIYWYGIIITFGLILAVVLCSRAMESGHIRQGSVVGPP